MSSALVQKAAGGQVLTDLQVQVMLSFRNLSKDLCSITAVQQALSAHLENGLDQQQPVSFCFKYQLGCQL